MEGIANLSRKEQVIRKAAELFKEKGYAAASMRDLAQLLGIGFPIALLFFLRRTNGERGGLGRDPELA